MRKLLYSLLGILLFGIISYSNVVTANAADPLVIVIDPGHGGNNKGADYLPVPEKNYNMVVALYMKNYLEQYQNISVYLTHTEDTDMSLKERAEFAQSVNADFLFSLHFNMSIDHNLYGAEVWIPSNGIFYSQGYGVGYELLNEFEEMGIFNRGIKTRVGKTDDDYYGIIRQCGLVNIPAVIVEHCHVDHANDVINLMTDEKLREFGERDAKAVARYFGLTSADNTMDFSNYAPLAVPIPSERVYQDSTPPCYVYASLLKVDNSRRYASFQLSAWDNESSLQYYSYSLDGGLTWSTYQPWNKPSNSMTLTVNGNLNKKSHIIFKVLNQYDQDTLSNVITF